MNKQSLIILLLVFFCNIRASHQIPFRQIGSANADIRCFSLTPGKNFLFAANYNMVEIFDLRSGQLINTIHYRDSSVIRSIILSSDSSTLVTGFSSGLIVIHDLINNNFKDYSCSEFMITTISIQSDLLALGTYNGEVILMNKNGEIRERKKIHDDVVTKVEISSDARLLASAGMDGKLNIWDLKNGNKVYCLKKNKKPCRDVEISSDVLSLAACYDNGKVESWRINSDNSIELRDKSHLKGWVMDVCFFENGKTLATCSSTGKILIRTSIGQDYTAKLNYPLYQISFVPLLGMRLCVVVSERSKGLKILSAVDMEMKY